jgi:hypothetical protein
MLRFPYRGPRSRTALRYFLHRFQLRLAILALLALLTSQLGAMAHAYSHDAALPSNSMQRSGAASHDGCNDCLAYAALLSAGAAPGSLPFTAPPPRGHPARALRHGLPDLPLTLAFRSRAPPRP